MKKQIKDWFHNNRRSLTILVGFFTILLSALLGGILSYILSEASLPRNYLILLIIVIIIIMTIIIIFWDEYNKPSRLQTYQQLNKIERKIDEIHEKIIEDSLK